MLTHVALTPPRRDIRCPVASASLTVFHVHPCRSCVEPEEQNTASSMMAAFLGVGLCLGALFSNVTIKII